MHHQHYCTPYTRQCTTLLSHPAHISPYSEEARICVNQYAEQHGGALVTSILIHSALNQPCAPCGPNHSATDRAASTETQHHYSEYINIISDN